MLSLFASLAGSLLFIVDYSNPETISIQEGLKKTGYAFIQYFVGVMFFCLLYFYVLKKMEGITPGSILLYAQHLWKRFLVREEARRLGISYGELLQRLKPSEKQDDQSRKLWGSSCTGRSTLNQVDRVRCRLL